MYSEAVYIERLRAATQVVQAWFNNWSKEMEKNVPAVVTAAMNYLAADFQATTPKQY